MIPDRAQQLNRAGAAAIPAPAMAVPPPPPVPNGQPRDRGICGADAPTLTESTRGGLCTLLAGHAGWHRADDGMSWTDRPGVPGVGAVVLDDLDRLIADSMREPEFARAFLAGQERERRAAYERGVAEGRRQATEGWEREWGYTWGDPGNVSWCKSEREARHFASIQPGRTVISRLVGPREATEQAEATPESRRCPSCGEPTAGVWPDRAFGRAYEPCGCAAEQDGDGRGQG